MSVRSLQRERPMRRVYIAALGILLFALLSIVVVLPVWTYRHLRTQLENELEQRLLSIGQVIAQGLPAGALGDSTHSSDAGAAGAGLRRIASAGGLGSIQVLDAERRLRLGTREAVPLGDRDPFLSAQPEVAAALAGIPAATPLYEAPEIPGVFFKTGFVPIEEADGRILGVVAVEGGSSFFEPLPALRRTWWITGLGAAFIAVLLVALLIGVFRALERYERGLRGTAALATAGQLAAVAAHEIRNPLATLLSRAERVQRDLESGGDPRDASRLLDVVPAEIRRLDRILTNYLSLARVGSGDGRCAVVPVIEETLELVENDLARSGIRANLAVASRDLRVRIDSGPLRQALINLFLNARDAMPRGGTLDVRAAEEGGWIRIDVADSGTGIDRKALRSIFEPFYTTRPTGSGLGLAVVDSVVRSAGGRVDVESERGRGSRFTLRLPQDEKGGEDGAIPGSVPDPPRGG